MKVGFIGAGSMGSMLTGSFIRSGALRPADILLSSRTLSKANALANRYPGLQIAPSNASAALDSDLVFLCVKPMDFRGVLQEIAPVVQPWQIVVSITSPVRISSLEEHLPCKVAKIIPSIVNETLAGSSLVMFGSRLEERDRALLFRLFSSISRPIQVAEEEVRVASDIASCGPAFMANLLEQFIEAAVSTTGIARETASVLARDMLLGTARLLQTAGCSPAELQKRVSVPGGITAAALEELKQATDGAFLRVLRTTHAKFAEDLDKVDASLNSDG
ncbi:late competence protein ComER [Cohnella thailandensis]|uniref:Pyrroline-5-carboxylate reductase n=1 Tax=Cohnella thailandensis TaxID=557557 RepID=A0A841T0U5_9BACL|nr:late competence protein ComER [Cohnella thailandensis]MBB6636175.1 late competence protein ComER [Cohnella thailandensis]MBP1973856.1 competence protein ComER [Cohnella thailandensis]